MPSKGDTARLRAARTAVKEARARLEAAALASDEAAISIATLDLARAIDEERLAAEDAESRWGGGRRNARKDGAPTSDQVARRKRLQSALEINEELIETPHPQSRMQLAIPLKPWVVEALKLWEEDCAVLGAATIGRWMLISALLRVGRPPGWQGEWPPIDEN